MDDRTLRRLLDPFEVNVMLLAARFRGDLDEVARALAGREARVHGHFLDVRGHPVSSLRVAKALASARFKIERHVHGMTTSAPSTAPEAVSLDGIEDQLARALEAGGYKRRGAVRVALAVEWLRRNGPASSLRLAHELGVPEEAQGLANQLRDHEEVEATGQHVKDWPLAPARGRPATEYAFTDMPDSEREERREAVASEAGAGEGEPGRVSESAMAAEATEDHPTPDPAADHYGAQDRLATVLYLLLRDELPAGKLLHHVHVVEGRRERPDHTNDLLHALAADTARRILGEAPAPA